MRILAWSLVLLLILAIFCQCASQHSGEGCKDLIQWSSYNSVQAVETGEGENVKTSTRDMNTNTNTKMANLNKDDRMA